MIVRLTRICRRPDGESGKKVREGGLTAPVPAVDQIITTENRQASIPSKIEKDS